jgi:hypothetical protein
MLRTKPKTDLGKNAVDTGQSVSAAVESASNSVAAGIDELVLRGRKAKREAKAEAQRRRKEAEKAARKQVTKARKKAQKRVDKAQRKLNQAREDIAVDAQYRADGLSRAKQGHPKRSGTTKKLVKAVSTVAAVGAVASRAMRGRNSPPAT